MRSIEFFIPGPPVAKGRPRFTKRGFAYTPEKTKNAELNILAHMPDGEKLVGPIKMTLWFFMPIPKSWPKKKQALAVAGLIRPTTKPDADNLAKLVADAMNGVCFQDDSQVVSLEIQKYYGAEPRTVVRLREINPGENK